MGAISRWLDRFCYKHPRLGIPGLMKYIVIANVAVYLMGETCFLPMLSTDWVSC